MSWRPSFSQPCACIQLSVVHYIDCWNSQTEQPCLGNFTWRTMQMVKLPVTGSQ